MKFSEFWTDCYGGKTKIVTIGKSILDREGLEHSNLVIIIPGNPGVAGFYKSLMKSLYASSCDPDLSIWAVSYIGHEWERQSYLPTEETFGLRDQVRHKLSVLEKFVPASTRVTLVGHSIGCKIILDMLKEVTTHNVEKFVLKFCIKKHLPHTFSEFIDAVFQLGNPNSINNILTLAHEELTTVNELDSDAIKQQVGRLRVYYGSNDGWCPLEYRTNLLESVPSFDENDAKICAHNIKHAFVIESGYQMGEILSDWMKD